MRSISVRAGMLLGNDGPIGPTSSQHQSTKKSKIKRNAAFTRTLVLTLSIESKGSSTFAYVNCYRHPGDHLHDPAPL